MDSDYLSSEEMETLWLKALDLSSELELDQLLAMVVKSSRSLSSADTGEIYLLKEGKLLRRVEVHSAEGPTTPSILPNTLEMGEGLVGRVVKTGEVVVIDNLDVGHGRSPVRGRRPISSMIGVPLVANGVTLGVLSVSIFDKEKRFGDRTAQLLTMFASSAAIAIANALEIMHLKEEIMTLEDLAKETLQRLQPERKAAVEAISIRPREDVEANGAVTPGENSAHSLEEKLAAFHRLQGMLKTDAPPLTDEELKEDYINYLAEKYS